MSEGKITMDVDLKSAGIMAGIATAVSGIFVGISKLFVRKNLLEHQAACRKDVDAAIEQARKTQDIKTEATRVALSGEFELFRSNVQDHFEEQANRISGIEKTLGEKIGAIQNEISVTSTDVKWIVRAINGGKLPPMDAPV
jgi:hypothetical protein